MAFDDDDEDTVNAQWKAIRLLEADLEFFAKRYQVDCRGLGFSALASALYDRGWRSQPKQPTTKQVRHAARELAALRSSKVLAKEAAASFARISDMSQASRVETLLAFVSEAAERCGFTLEQICEPLPRKARKTGDYMVLAAAKRSILGRACFLTDENGNQLLTQVAIAETLGVERSLLGGYKKYYARSQG